MRRKAKCRNPQRCCSFLKLPCYTGASYKLEHTWRRTDLRGLADRGRPYIRIFFLSILIFRAVLDGNAAMVKYEVKWISVEFCRVVKKKRMVRTKPGAMFTFRRQAEKEESVKEIVEKAAGERRENPFPDSCVKKVFQ